LHRSASIHLILHCVNSEPNVDASNDVFFFFL
jgi:hypothetical protein